MSSEAEMGLPELPPLRGAVLIESAIQWQQESAELLLLLPEETFLIRLQGLLQLKLPRGTAHDAHVECIRGPIRAETGNWRLALAFVGGGLFEAEFQSLEVQRGFPGQRRIHETDLYSKLRDIMRSIMDALVRNDAEKIPRLARSYVLPHEAPTYPTAVVHPPPDAYERMEVETIGSQRGRWRVEMPLWTPDGRSGSYTLSVEVRRVDGDLVGFMEAINAR